MSELIRVRVRMPRVQRPAELRESPPAPRASVVAPPVTVRDAADRHRAPRGLER